MRICACACPGGSRMKIAICVFLLTLGVKSTGSAQNISGSLSGTVQDKLGAVLPEAIISVTNEQGFIRTTKTNEVGFFSLPDLTPSTFTIQIKLPGFKQYTQTGIE